MKTQAWGWLAAAVLAAGLNASYHDGGLQWLHQAVEQMEHSSAAVVALAAGHTEQFLAEARLVSNQSSAEQFSSDETASSQISTDQISPDQLSSDQVSSGQIASEQAASKELVAKRDENRSCPWARAMARVHSKVARMEISFARLEEASDRKQADLDRQRARQERLQAQVVAQTDRFRATAAAFSPVVMKMVEIPAHCQGLQKLLLQRESLRHQTIRINLPRNMAAPSIDLPQVFAPENQLDLASAGPV